MTNKKNRKILFVSHKANRSGAPVLLLEIMIACRRQNIPFQILCMEDGELIPEFRKLANTFIWRKKIFSTTGGPLAGFLFFFNRVIQVLHGSIIMLRVRNTSLVFYNTIVNGWMQHKLAFLRAQSICYVHELEAAIHMLTNEKGREYVFRYTDLFLTVSEAVSNNLVVNHGVNSSIVKMIASPVSETCRSKEAYAEHIRAFRETYHTGDATIIGVAGGNEWRKGFDYFLPLAVLYFQLFPNDNTYFVWKGFREGYYTSYFDKYDFDRCAHKDRILLLPYGKDNIEQMAAYDIHLLLSKEDPYPLVVLEAASLAIPTVCFENAGGAQEFVETDCGIIVPYGDLYQMAHRLHDLAHNKALLGQMGRNCRQKLDRRHNKQHAINQVTAIILNDTAVTDHHHHSAI